MGRRIRSALVAALLLTMALLGAIMEVGEDNAAAEAANRIVWQFGETGNPGGGANQLYSPCAVHLLDGGGLIIADQGNCRVVELDVNGTAVWQYGTTGVKGSGPDQLGQPAWEAQRLVGGNTLITDTENQRVIEVDPQKAIVWQYGDTGSSATLFFPRDAERLANGNTLIADTDHWRILEVDAQKTTVWEYSGVNLPTDADRLGNGNTLISEPDGFRVFEVDPSKNVVWEYGSGTMGFGEGQVGHIWDADRLANGNTLITDADNHRVIEVTPDKRVVWQYGINGTRGDGPGLLAYPYDAERLADGSTLIADMDNHRVIRVGPEEENMTILFQEGFSGDLSKWDLFGFPRPFIDRGALKGNGDGTYGSDAVSLGAFNRSDGDLIVEARIKVSRTLRPGWFGLGEITSGNPGIDPSETVYYGFRFQGTLYGERLTFTYLRPNGTAASSSISWPVYGSWHVYRVEVRWNGGADFFVDGDLKFSVPETEREASIDDWPVIAGSHDPPYWFDDIVVKLRSLPPLPPQRWGLSVVTDKLVYEPGDTVSINAFHWRLSDGALVGDELVSFQVDAPGGTIIAVTSERTSAFGWANTTIRLAPEGPRGPHVVYATVKGAEANASFRVGRLPLFIVSVVHLTSYALGDTMDIEVGVASSQGSTEDLLLVLQAFDTLRTPLPPAIQKLNLQPYGMISMHLSIPLRTDLPKGEYTLESQLMTGLPKDHGYAIDISTSRFTVG